MPGMLKSCTSKRVSLAVHIVMSVKNSEFSMLYWLHVNLYHCTYIINTQDWHSGTKRGYGELLVSLVLNVSIGERQELLKPI